MPRDLRHVPPGSVLEITTRCVGEKMFMVPTPEVTEAILGVLGFALFLFPSIELHSFIFLSNHYHILLTAHDPETLSRFLCFLNGNIARKVSWLLGYKGPFWSRRYADIPVVDDQAQLDRLFYLFENGCKEGLVASPADWPGPTAARALAFGERLTGKWVDATGIVKAKKKNRKAKINVADFTHEFPITLTPLPCLRSVTTEERQSVYLGMLEQVRAKYAHQTPMGSDAVLRQEPQAAPKTSKRSPEPKCHASSEELWLIQVRAHEALVDLYRRQSEKIRSGQIPPSARPANTHPPPMHWDPRRNTRSAPILDAHRAPAHA